MKYLFVSILFLSYQAVQCQVTVKYNDCKSLTINYIDDHDFKINYILEKLNSEGLWYKKEFRKGNNSMHYSDLSNGIYRCKLLLDNVSRKTKVKNSGLKVFTSELLHINCASNRNRSDKELVVFPNPANEMLYIAIESTDFKVKIYSIEGQLVNSDMNNSIINLKDLENGVYILEVTESGVMHTQKLLIQK